MSTRLTRRGSFVVGLSIVVMLLVSAPMLAFANSSAAPTTPPGNSAAAPGQSDAVPPGQSEDAAPGNSASAPGQEATTTTTTTTPPPAPGKSSDAPGQNKPDTSTTVTTPPGNSGNSNAGGNSANAGGANSNGGGSSAGGDATGNSGSGGGNPDSGDSGSNNGDPAGEGDCDQNDGGTGGPYDANCDGTHQNPGPGKSDNSPGKPADGTVGNADNKNPKGQQPGGNDKNKGYECEPGSSNKGVGRGNPAHSGCAPPPCPGGYSLTVNVTYVGSGTGTVSHTTGTYPTAVTSITATGTNGSVATPTSQSVTYVNCAGSAQVVFSKTENCPNGFSLNVTSSSVNGGTGTASPSVGSHSYPASPPTTVTATGTSGSSASPASQTVTYTNCAASAQVTFTKSGGGGGGGGGCVTNCGSLSLPDCDSDGVDDNVDPDISSCHPLPPKTDCDRDGIPDDVDTDTASCDPDEVLGIVLCPDGTVMPPSGKCPDPDLMPDAVLGIRLNQSPEVAPAAVNNPGVAASLLPFTGGNIFPFVLVSLSLIGAGLPAVLRRRSKEN